LTASATIFVALQLALQLFTSERTTCLQFGAPDGRLSLTSAPAFWRAHPARISRLETLGMFESALRYFFQDRCSVFSIMALGMFIATLTAFGEMALIISAVSLAGCRTVANALHVLLSFWGFSPALPDFTLLFRMSFRPFADSANMFIAMLHVPRMLIFLVFFSVLVVVLTLVLQCLISIFSVPSARSRDGALAISPVVLPSLLAEFGRIFLVLSSAGHGVEVYHHNTKGATNWTLTRTINSNDNFLCTSLIESSRRALSKIQTNFKYSRINRSPYPQQCGIRKFSLIDLDPAMGTRRKATSHRERLSERTSIPEDATVWTHGKWNHERLAEMTNPALLGA